jgi:hypothetical protein
MEPNGNKNAVGLLILSAGLHYEYSPLAGPNLDQGDMYVTNER